MFCFEHLVKKMVPLTEMGKTGGSTGFGSGRAVRSSLKHDIPARSSRGDVRIGYSRLRVEFCLSVILKALDGMSSLS